MKKTPQQKAIDNRANQLNPNNPAYYKSRIGSTYPTRKNYKQSKAATMHQNHFERHHLYNQVSGSSQESHGGVYWIIVLLVIAIISFAIGWFLAPYLL